MKTRWTYKMLTGRPVITICYCGAQYLLSGLEPIGYTAGVYGWNNDIYASNGVYIVTGYRFYGIRGFSPDYTMLRNYDKKAADILSWENKSMTYEEKLDKVADLRAQFIDEQLFTIQPQTFSFGNDYRVDISDNMITVTDFTTFSGVPVKKSMYIRRQDIRRSKGNGTFCAGEKYISIIDGGAALKRFFDYCLKHQDFILFSETHKLIEHVLTYGF